MKFSTREDISAPINHVWAQVSDVAMFERQALRRGADVRRIDQGPVGPGSAWDVAFKFRGKDRQMKVTLAAMEPPQAIRVDITANAIDGTTRIELVALSPQRTRLAMSIDLAPKSLAARLMIQSLKLAKSNLNARFKKRVGEYAQEIEDRYKPGA